MGKLIFIIVSSYLYQYLAYAVVVILNI